jgi:hypothetical protein
MDSLAQMAMLASTSKNEKKYSKAKTNINRANVFKEVSLADN